MPFLAGLRRTERPCSSRPLLLSHGRSLVDQGYAKGFRLYLPAHLPRQSEHIASVHHVRFRSHRHCALFFSSPA